MCRGRPSTSRSRSVASNSGSSSSSDSLRDEGAPEADESCEVRRDGCDDEASEASSRESRVGGGRLA